MKLTEHFFVEEVSVTSHKGVDNTPSSEILSNAKFIAYKMERVRHLLRDNVITVLSWYRSKQLNKLVGGSKKSDHLKATAIDFVCFGFGSPRQVCIALTPYLVELGINQLIYEGTWVHISFSIPPSVPKHQVLTYDKRSKTYLTGLVETS